MAALSNELWVLSLNDLAKYAAAKDHSLRIVIAGSSQDPKQGDGAYEDELAVVRGIIENAAEVKALL
jgi:hypothetical protein